jgi:hypothetical protein
MEQLKPDEEIDLGQSEYVQLRFFRRWPHYVVEWTTRRRDSEGSSFPLSQGEVVSTVEPDWDALKASAVEQAREGISSRPSTAPPPATAEPEKTGLFGLFRKKS